MNSRLLFKGTITSLDLSGLVFSRCEFRDITFSRCVFDSSTKFVRCKFDGRLEIDNASNFGTVDLDDHCQFSPAAFETIQTAVGAKKIFVSESLVLDNFQIVLSRFKQGLGFKSLERRNLNRGAVAQSPLRDDVLFETRDIGHVFDDLMLVLKRGLDTTNCFVSIKSNRHLTKHGFNREFVEDAWSEWNGGSGSTFNRSKDILGLIVVRTKKGDIESRKHQAPSPARSEKTKAESALR